MADAFDVIVVGARCAGAPLATFLARAGLRTCVVDRATFPKDTPSTHGIQPTGVKVLERLGVVESLLQVTPPVDHGSIAFDDTRVDLHGVTGRVGAPMLNARRVTLDSILQDAAQGAGAELRTGAAVEGLIEENGRVAGVRTSAGDLHAPLVVGADGYHSSVAELVGAEEYCRTASGSFFTWAYFENATQDDRVWIGRIGDQGFLASPTDGGLFLVAVVPSVERHAEVSGDRERSFDRALESWPELRECVVGAKRVGPIRVVANLDGYFRRSAGPGWALVGDAGHFKDPTPGQGIADALRQSERLADAVVLALGGGNGNGDGILRDWWHWRDRDAWEMYWFAHDMAQSGELPLIVQEMQQRLVSTPELTDKLLRILNHDLAPSEVFTPGLSLSVAAGALRRRRGQRRQLLRETGDLVGAEIRRARGRRRIPS